MRFKNLKIEHILLVVLMVSLFLIGVSFWNQLNFPDANYQLKKGMRVEISSGETLQQKFVADYNGLSNLKILFGGKSLARNHSLDLILAGQNCQKEIRKKTLISGQEFSSRNLYDFKFVPVDNSKNKVYCLIVKYKTTTKNTVKRMVRLFENESTIERTILKNCEYTIIDSKKNGRRVNRKNALIVFRPSYKSTVIKNFSQLNQRMSQYKPWFLKKGYLIIIIVLTIFLTGKSIKVIINKNNK